MRAGDAAASAAAFAAEVLRSSLATARNEESCKGQ